MAVRTLFERWQGVLHMLAITKQRRPTHRLLDRRSVRCAFVAQRLTLGAPRPAECTDTYKNIQLFTPELVSRHNIFEACVRAIAQSFLDDAMRHRSLERLNMNKP